MSTYQITRAQYAATVAKVDQANARAAKKGLSGRVTIEGTTVLVTEKDEHTGIDRTFEMVDVELGGIAPKYDGWTFLAILDWDVEAGLIVRSAPGIKKVDRSNLVEGKCDHCKTNRQRNDTYLLRHEDGREVQVGSTCIKDFLGLEVGIAWLDAASFASEFSEGGLFSGPINHGTEYVLALAWALIKLDGWKPASSFGSTTKGDVLDILYPPRHVDDEYRAWAGRVKAVAAEAAERAAEVRAFILSDNFGGDSDYVINLKNIVEADMVSDRNLGYLVSAPQAWAKYLERTLAREVAASTPSEWVGTKDEKITVTAVIRGIKFIETQYGVTVLYTFRDAGGNVYKWFASRDALGDATDIEVTIKATVKGHEEFRGTKETILTRAKAV